MVEVVIFIPFLMAILTRYLKTYLLGKEIYVYILLRTPYVYTDLVKVPVAAMKHHA